MFIGEVGDEFLKSEYEILHFNWIPLQFRFGTVRIQAQYTFFAEG